MVFFLILTNLLMCWAACLCVVILLIMVLAFSDVIIYDPLIKSFTLTHEKEYSKPLMSTVTIHEEGPDEQTEAFVYTYMNSKTESMTSEEEDLAFLENVPHPHYETCKCIHHNYHAFYFLYNVKVLFFFSILFC